MLSIACTCVGMCSLSWGCPWEPASQGKTNKTISPGEMEAGIDAGTRLSQCRHINRACREAESGKTTCKCAHLTPLEVGEMRVSLISLVLAEAKLSLRSDLVLQGLSIRCDKSSVDHVRQCPFWNEETLSVADVLSLAPSSRPPLAAKTSGEKAGGEQQMAQELNVSRVVLKYYSSKFSKIDFAKKIWKLLCCKRSYIFY